MTVNRNGATVSRVFNENDADVLALTLQEEMPWMGPATEHIWHAMRQSVREGRPGFKFAPWPTRYRQVTLGAKVG